MGLTDTQTHRCQVERHLALIQTMRGWAEVAAGLSIPLDQFGVSHTSQRGYLPFSEVQREDKMKESSHLIKGKRRNKLWAPSLQNRIEGVILPSPPTLPHSLTLTHDFIHSLTHSQQLLMVTKLCGKPCRETKRSVKQLVPAPKELTV